MFFAVNGFPPLSELLCPPTPWVQRLHWNDWTLPSGNRGPIAPSSDPLLWTLWRKLHRNHTCQLQMSDLNDFYFSPQSGFLGPFADLCSAHHTCPSLGCDRRSYCNIVELEAVPQCFAGHQTILSNTSEDIPTASVVRTSGCWLVMFS